MGMVHWSKWLPCPYMVKAFKNLLLQNQISSKWALIFGLKLWGTGDLPKLLKWWFYVEICFSMHLYRPYTFILKVSKWLAYLQWLCHSGEWAVARGPLVILLVFFFSLSWYSSSSVKISWLCLRNRSALAVIYWVINHCLEISCKEDQIMSVEHEWYIYLQPTNCDLFLNKSHTKADLIGY